MRCDEKAPTLTIFKARQSGFIFGGYTEAAWINSRLVEGETKEDHNAFIFSLTNKDNRPIKMKTSNPNDSIYCAADEEPSFGRGDITVGQNSFAKARSSSCLGQTYKHPLYKEDSKEAESFLAGSEKFRLEEIEVYQQEYKKDIFYSSNYLLK